MEYIRFLRELDEGLTDLNYLVGAQLAEDIIKNPEKRTEGLFALAEFTKLRLNVRKEIFRMEKYGC
jgi:hypothetical protein